MILEQVIVPALGGGAGGSSVAPARGNGWLTALIFVGILVGLVYFGRWWLRNRNQPIKNA